MDDLRLAGKVLHSAEWAEGEDTAPYVSGVDGVECIVVYSENGGLGWEPYVRIQMDNGRVHVAAARNFFMIIKGAEDV